MALERIAAVLLAAGAGVRFGGGKLDAMLGDKRVGTWAWATLAAFRWQASGIVVPDAVPAFATESCAALIANSDAASGMASSIRHAVRFAEAAGADALLIALADMPFVRAETIAALILRHDGDDPDAVTATLYPDGSAGAPSLFGCGCFDALLAIEGDRGAGAYLVRRSVETVEIDAAELRDIDRLADL
ncbi:nucleotidyltransferase family protein [Novosphingopyxis sp.]|uniref:nucleotidyltransferase family protein n=1 Tax=Novosphingopyxis sp. TaxID=2709690 RepID=UPI003B5C430D